MKKILLLLLLIPINIHAFNSNAKSTVVIDIDSKRIIYSENPHYTQSVASISKIMTAIIVIENTDINKKVTINKEILKSYGSGIYIKPKEKLKIKDLLYGLMLRSGNDAAIALTVATSKDTKEFVKLMNKKAKELKMEDTTFHNPTGLDQEKDGGNISSAHDMAILMCYAMKNKTFREITSTKYYTLKTNKNVYKWKNKNKLLFSYKYTNGGKTGFTKKAKRTLVTSAKKDGLALAIVTIKDGSDWLDHKKIYEEAFAKYKSYRILSKGKINIIGENYYKNKLYLKHNFNYPLLDSEKETITIKYKLKKKKNYKNKEIVGRALVYMSNKKIYSQNIYIEK